MNAKTNPLGCGRSGEGAQGITQSPHSSAVIEAVDIVCRALNANLIQAKPDWRDGLAQGSPAARNYEHKTFVTADSREGRRKLARLAKKGKAK